MDEKFDIIVAEVGAAHVHIGGWGGVRDGRQRGGVCVQAERNQTRKDYSPISYSVALCADGTGKVTHIGTPDGADRTTLGHLQTTTRCERVVPESTRLPSLH